MKLPEYSTKAKPVPFEVAHLPKGTWSDPLKLNGFSLWADSTGKLRIKAGNPTSDLDGALVGLQT